VAALHQGARGQMTWLEDPPPWLRPAHWSSTFSRKKVHPGDLAGGCYDLEMTWLLSCAGAATAYNYNVFTLFS